MIGINSDNMIGLLLAAGLSRRFGSTNKLLHPLSDGSPIALSAARNLVAVIPLSIAVVRPENHALRKMLEEAGLQVVSCSEHDKAMSNSLEVAVEFSEKFSDADEGFIIALADMPFITPDTIARVADQIRRGSPIAVPTYKGKRGHPVGFSSRFRDELQNLSGDMGARPILQRHADEVQYIETDDPGILIDIDFPSDIEA